MSVSLTSSVTGTELGRKTRTNLLETGRDKGRDSYVEMRTLDLAVLPTYHEQPCGLNGSVVNKKNIVYDTVQSDKCLLNCRRNNMPVHSRWAWWLVKQFLYSASNTVPDCTDLNSQPITLLFTEQDQWFTLLAGCHYCRWFLYWRGQMLFLSYAESYRAKLLM